MKIVAETLADVDVCAETLKKLLPESGVVLFFGEMGSGKTTLIKSFCRAIGVEDEVSSPTFSLVNEYQTSSGKRVFHFDLYRLESPEEALDIGIEEYFDGGGLCLVEWPERLGFLMPENGINIHIKVVNNQREIVVESFV
ncbi:MAG: tRNA (adenosine(37)-N6)-threonylcarbamoyltransferase complex ATPase subunit type 1 TsaE [Cryomorphaceae bacterium]|nr:tRNA (adenosine(37)-N6)-threonylcarbamoyltransferase complex ATPase subunit type 1 TsaE [Cryomorphaceae bacterium]